MRLASNFLLQGGTSLEAPSGRDKLSTAYFQYATLLIEYEIGEKQ